MKCPLYTQENLLFGQGFPTRASTCASEVLVLQPHLFCTTNVYTQCRVFYFKRGFLLVWEEEPSASSPSSLQHPHEQPKVLIPPCQLGEGVRGMGCLLGSCNENSRPGGVRLTEVLL